MTSLNYPMVKEHWAGLDDLPDEKVPASKRPASGSPPNSSAPDGSTSNEHAPESNPKAGGRMPANTAPKSLESLNSHPVNRAAAKWLRRASSPPDQNWLYLLQLMWWGLNESSLKFGPKALDLRADLDSAVNALLGRTDHQHVWNYLMHGAEGELSAALTVETLNNAQDPKDAAWRALDALSLVMGGDPRSRNVLDE